MTNPTAPQAPAAPDFEKMARLHFIGDDVMSKALRGAFIDGAIQGLASSSAERSALEKRVRELEGEARTLTARAINAEVARDGLIADVARKEDLRRRANTRAEQTEAALASSSAERSALEKRVGESERTMRGYQLECLEVEQTLGRALGYPWLKDDQANFPGATEADGVCVGEHVPGSIASEAANKIAQLEKRVEELEEKVWCARLEEQESEDARQSAVAALAAAHQRWAEAMREACMIEATRCVSHSSERASLRQAIRAIPIPPAGEKE